MEHIKYEHLDETIKILLTNTRKKFMGIVPLASDGSVYDIRAYELDSTHKIRESIDWWRDKFFKHAMNQDRKVDVNVTFDLGQLKNNWTKVNPKGNALIIVEFKEQ